MNTCNSYDNELNIPFLRSKNRFLLSHHNIRSFNSNYLEFSAIMNNFSVDLYAFSETWFSDSTCLPIDSFNDFHTMRPDRRGGGVSIYVRNCYKSFKVSKLSGIKKSFEACAVEVFITSNFPVLFVSIYRPPSSNTTEFNNDISTFLSENIGPQQNVFLLGDLNIDISSNNLLGQELINTMQSFNFEPLIDKPTRVSHIIDHIWTNYFDFPYESGVLECDITDHHIIVSSFQVETISKTITKKFRDHSDVSIVKLKLEFANFIENEVDFDCALEVGLANFTRDLYNIYDRCCPIRTKTLTSNRESKPWLTNHSIKLARFKIFLYNQSLNNYIPRYIYTNFKNHVSSLLEKTKDTYLKQKFSSSAGDMKKTWRNVDSLLRHSPDKVKHITLQTSDGIKLLTDKEVANEFNSYFSNVASILDNNIPVTAVSPMSYMQQPNVSSFFVTPSTAIEVKNLIMNCKSKSCPLNQIPIYVYKQIVDLLSQVISFYFNESISLGSFPDVLKITRVIPLFKKGDNSSVSNYRPISILPFISKIFEKLMCKRLNQFLTEHRIICKHQFGFRTGLSTSDAIVEFLDGVYDALDRGNALISVFLDFSRAFDTVNHRILLDKLYYYGVRGIVHEWFRSYLHNRVQYVSNGDAVSSFTNITSGVPEGAVLAPLLFSLYINDMYLCCPNLQLIHYADDTTAYVSGAGLGDLVHVVNQELELVRKWLQSNRLSLNID